MLILWLIAYRTHIVTFWTSICHCKNSQEKRGATFTNPGYQKLLKLASKRKISSFENGKENMILNLKLSINPIGTSSEILKERHMNNIIEKKYVSTNVDQDFVLSNTNCDEVTKKMISFDKKRSR